jgi:hypothetical protein
MANGYRKTAPKRVRVNRRYGDLVKLAAQIAHRSIWTVYGVIHGRVKSEPIRRALDQAEVQLRREKRRAA